MEEKNFQRKLIKYFESLGCFVTKYNASGISKVGVPDLSVCFKGIYLGVEVKKESGVISDIQQWNINQIRNAGGRAICIKPQDFDNVRRAIETSTRALDEIQEICACNEKEITKID